MVASEAWATEEVLDVVKEEALAAAMEVAAEAESEAEAVAMAAAVSEMDKVATPGAAMAQEALASEVEVDLARDPGVSHSMVMSSSRHKSTTAAPTLSSRASHASRRTCFEDMELRTRPCQPSPHELLLCGLPLHGRWLAYGWSC